MTPKNKEKDIDQTFNRSRGQNEQSRKRSNFNLFEPILNFRKVFSEAAGEGFGTKARNVATTMSVGDVVVPLCANIEQRQLLANRGIYPGVEYIVCSLSLPPLSSLNDNNSNMNGDNIDNQQQKKIQSMTEIPSPQQSQITAFIKPAYKLRKHLERSDWPVAVQPTNVESDVPLWLSKTTYEAGTALGTAGLALTYTSIAAVLAFWVRIVYVPSESMMPALNPGNVVLVSRSLFGPNVGDVVLFDPPAELEQIVKKNFKAMASNGDIAGDNSEDIGLVPISDGQQLLKRIVGVPGEVVGVKNSEPYVALDYTSKFDGGMASSNKNKYEDSDKEMNGDIKRKFRVDIVGPYSKPDTFSESSWDRPADPSNALRKNEYFVAGDNGYRSVDSRVWGPLHGKYVFGTAKWVIWPMQDFGPIKNGQIFNIEK